MDAEHLEVLHAHYSESFATIRERERQRDRTLYLFLGLLGLVTAAVEYFNGLVGVLSSASLGGVKANLTALPGSPLLATGWTFTFLLSLKYCQLCINTDRQYDYLHKVERELSKAVGSEELFRREGAAYLDDYPLFSDWAWINYIYTIPAIICFATVFLSISEWAGFTSPWYFKLYDSLLALAVILNLFLYRFLPLLKRRLSG